MRSLIVTPLLVSVVSLVFSVCAYSFELPPPEKFHNGLSLQGITGILNAPNAHVTDEGYLYALYSNQKESKWRDRVSYQDNYLFSVGFFNFAEFGGRLFDAPGIGRDLSANFKVTTEPFFRKYRYAPVLAVGIQDIGGGSTFFNAKYAVISEDIWRFRLSAGYAGSSTGNYPTKGKFAGAEFKAHDWVYLLSDYDTRETNVGMRVVTPQFWRIPISFTATAKSSLSHRPGNIDIAVGLNFPLDFQVRKKTPSVESISARPPVPAPEPASAQVPDRPSPSPAAQDAGATTDVPKAAELERLRVALTQFGFTNVRIGSAPAGTLVVEYENPRLNHNELDGVGVVAGAASRLVRHGYDSLRLVIRRHDIRMVRLTMPLATVDGFLNGRTDVSELNHALAVSFDTSDDDTVFATAKQNPGMFRASLMLYPGLTTFVGTEAGVFDYLLSVRPDLLVDAWKGAVLNARWDLPVSWSENLDEGQVYRNSRHPSRMERLMLFQGLKPSSDVMISLGGGMILSNQYGTLNEATWSPGNGSHRFRAVQVFARDKFTRQVTTTYLGSYRYYWAPLDLSLEGTGGRFWAEDTGFAFELKRIFGDATVSVYYKNSQKDSSKRWEAAGVQFSFPLSPRKDMKHFYRMQVRGSEEWSYAQETTLGKSNLLPSYPIAINPQPATALYRAYYNRDRLNEPYIRSHLQRLRDAWLKFGGDL